MQYSEAGKGDATRPTDKDAFDKGFDAIFGNKRAERGSYVFDKETGELVPKQDYSPSAKVYVMPDIQGYKSMQTGEWIGSRSTHREHLKTHRLVEIGNETKAHLTKQAPKVDREALRRDIHTSMQKLGY